MGVGLRDRLVLGFDALEGGWVRLDDVWRWDSKETKDRSNMWCEATQAVEHRALAVVVYEGSERRRHPKVVDKKLVDLPLA